MTEKTVEPPPTGRRVEPLVGPLLADGPWDMQTMPFGEDSMDGPLPADSVSFDVESGWEAHFTVAGPCRCGHRCQDRSWSMPLAECRSHE